MPIKPLRYTGTVIKRPYAAGSKSERDAVMLSTPKGNFVLKIRGHHPFSDPELEALVGENVELKGFRNGAHLIVVEWKKR